MELAGLTPRTDSPEVELTKQRCLGVAVGQVCITACVRLPRVMPSRAGPALQDAPPRRPPVTLPRSPRGQGLGGTGQLKILRGTAALTQDCSLTPKSYQFLEDLEIPTMQPLYACFSLHAFFRGE